MIKQIALIHRKPGLSFEEFDKYWREKHGPLAAKLIPGLKKYTQNHLLKVPRFNYEADGVVELWFDNLEAYQRFATWRQSSEAKELADDADKFRDGSKTVKFMVEEHSFL